MVARKVRRHAGRVRRPVGRHLDHPRRRSAGGTGVTQALDLIAEETASPTCDEFRRVIIESRVGRDLTDSLMDVADRMENDDFRWLAEAIAINRELGGDLAEVFDNIGRSSGPRSDTEADSSLAAEGRMSAYILIALPVSLFFYIQIVNPDYGGDLLTGPGSSAARHHGHRCSDLLVDRNLGSNY